MRAKLSCIEKKVERTLTCFITPYAYTKRAVTQAYLFNIEKNETGHPCFKGPLLI